MLLNQFMYMSSLSNIDHFDVIYCYSIVLNCIWKDVQPFWYGSVLFMLRYPLEKRILLFLNNKKQNKRLKIYLVHRICTVLVLWKICLENTMIHAFHIEQSIIKRTFNSIILKVDRKGLKGLDLGSLPTELSLYQHTRESVTFTVWFQYTGQCIFENQSTIYLQ